MHTIKPAILVLYFLLNGLETASGFEHGDPKGARSEGVDSKAYPPKASKTKPKVICKTDDKVPNDKKIKFEAEVNPTQYEDGQIRATLIVSVRGIGVNTKSGTSLNMNGEYFKTEKEEFTLYTSKYDGVIKDLRINHRDPEKSKVLIRLNGKPKEFFEINITCKTEPEKPALSDSIK